MDMSENTNNKADLKFDLWERKLLDLTTRNSLLNCKLSGKNVLPLMVTSASAFENKISQNKDYAIISRGDSGEDSEGNPRIPAGEYTMEELSGTDAVKPVLDEAIDAGKIYSSLAKADLDTRLKDIGRKARISYEEDGAASLFVACGFLKWKNPKDNVSCYAPILLVPVDLVRKFGVGKYLLRKNDSDHQVNITLLEKLRQDFDMAIPELEGDLPSDESGVDVEGVLNTVRGAISHKEGWEVIDSCVLGLFSFSQFVMWNDLHNHREEIASNKIVNSLIENRLTFEYEDMERDGASFTDESSVYLPISADLSQLYAIKRAGDGASFVLHGPPGTGKSQTITSMIANAIASGKKVLFVAEKKAALDVVYSRLGRIGIEPFCLELYSNKARKSYILDQLKLAGEVKLKGAPDGGYDKALADLEARRAELDSYNDEIIKMRSCGYSLYELMSIYAENKENPDIRLEDGFEEGLSEERNARTQDALRELAASSSGLSGKLGFVKATDYSQDTRFALSAEVQALDSAAVALKQALDSILSAYPKLGSSVDFANILRIKSWIDSFISWRNKLLANWTEGFLAADCDGLKARYLAAEGKFAPFRNSAKKKVYLEVRPYDKNGNALPMLKSHIEDLCNYRSSFLQVGFETTAPALSPVLTDFIKAFDNYRSCYEALYSRLKLSDECFKPEGGNLDRILSMTAELKADENLIRAKTIFNRTSCKCYEYKAGPVVEAFESGLISGDQLEGTFNKAWSMHMICKIMDSSDILKGFSGKIFDEKVKMLAKATSDFEKITRQEIYLKIARSLPDLNIDAAAQSGMGILQRAIKNGGRGITLRTLMNLIAPLILQLTPCILTSPMAAAQFIAPSKEPMFDMVIFDEASQLPTSKAVGVIARAKNAVIVGDPNQMPPTTFFKEQVYSDEDFEIEDLESILDDCLACGIPQTHLLWHYRSRHESLIQFSNKSFYDGRLYTFPSVDDRANKVTLVKCNGSFDSGRTRTNEEEAEAIAEELLSRFNDPEERKKTYGIVTFNIQQQSLIEDKIDDLCAKDPAFEEWAFGAEEPVFVKNLENVQGDERDCILFSVGYGPDSEGKVSMNFGPLNREGGWRRLNVAVTRSRTEMKVFSSIAPEQLKITDATPEGVKAFRNFLMYADGNPLWESELVTVADPDSSPLISRSAGFKGIAKDIIKRLDKRGYTAVPDVGRSGFKVNIGVLDPVDNSKYCLGIIIDGAGESMVSTATSREISQPGVLKGLGWKTLRVWAVEWWEDPDSVIDQCIDIIENGDKDPAPEEAEPAYEPVETAAPAETLDTSADTEDISKKKLNS